MWIDDWYRSTRTSEASLWPRELDAHYPRSEADRAAAEICQWPGYQPTPLYRLSKLATKLGVGEILYKDESNRFGLGSFKSLGGAYAVSQVLRRVVSARLGRQISTEQLRNGEFSESTRDMVMTTATDGNHGRSVAWGAGLFGCKALIYVHSDVSSARCEAILQLGAEIQSVTGSYDEAVILCQKDAGTHGRFLVADTTFGNSSKSASDVMSGYAMIADEIIQQLQSDGSITHLFVQAGVGGLAAALAARFWQLMGASRPSLSIVEPTDAACLFQSALSGLATSVPLSKQSIMAGLSCGAASPLAWKLIDPTANNFFKIGDRAVAPMMRQLASGSYGAPPIVAGESAVAGLAALIGCSDQSPTERDVGPTSTVLVIGTEGATDPAIYERLVGRPNASVLQE